MSQPSLCWSRSSAGFQADLLVFSCSSDDSQQSVASCKSEHITDGEDPLVLQYDSDSHCSTVYDRQIEPKEPRLTTQSSQAQLSFGFSPLQHFRHQQLRDASPVSERSLSRSCATPDMADFSPMCSRRDPFAFDEESSSSCRSTLETVAETATAPAAKASLMDQGDFYSSMLARKRQEQFQSEHLARQTAARQQQVLELQRDAHREESDTRVSVLLFGQQGDPRVLTSTPAPPPAPTKGSVRPSGLNSADASARKRINFKFPMQTACCEPEVADACNDSPNAAHAEAQVADRVLLTADVPVPAAIVLEARVIVNNVLATPQGASSTPSLGPIDSIVTDVTASCAEDDVIISDPKRMIVSLPPARPRKRLRPQPAPVSPEKCRAWSSRGAVAVVAAINLAEAEHASTEQRNAALFNGTFAHNKWSDSHPSLAGQQCDFDNEFYRWKKAVSQNSLPFASSTNYLSSRQFVAASEQRLVSS
eukprot:TRINITY_DN7602_c0_g1_i1.p1 TRINITY_DN7602_c0_g1~~TRINITY_DN7602_c0_g1_i1.p1  ORF type:complete len:478 (+),score=64.60 TRINITY_DN7602_c0_g1_i1:75-1508(+)